MFIEMIIRKFGLMPNDRAKMNNKIFYHKNSYRKFINLQNRHCNTLLNNTLLHIFNIMAFFDMNVFLFIMIKTSPKLDTMVRC